jgi:hypothetical protein
MTYFKILLSGLALLSVGFAFERSGTFLYFGYGLVQVFGACIALVFGAWGTSLYRSRKRGPSIAAALASVILLAAAWSVRNFNSGPRKQFYLRANQIKAGDSLDLVAHKMSQYPSWSAGTGYISFQFASRPGISDVVVVHYDPKTRKVFDSDLSLD